MLNSVEFALIEMFALFKCVKYYILFLIDLSRFILREKHVVNRWAIQNCRQMTLAVNQVTCDVAGPHQMCPLPFVSMPREGQDG